MRVLQIGPVPPPWGGVQTNMMSIRDYVRRHGARAELINVTRFRREAGDDVHYPTSAAGVLRLLWTLRYDVAHIHVGGTLPTRVLALMLACATNRGRPSVFTFHSGGFPSSPEGRAATPRSLLGFVLRRFDALIGVNQEIADLFRRLGVRDDRLHLVAPHAFGADVRRIAERGRASLPEPLRAFFDAHDPLLLSVSGLEPEYDVPMQIETLGAIRERHPRAGLLILGSGSLEAEVRARIAAAPWREHILLAGDIPREVTLLAIAEAAAVLRTTLYDGDAISVREALHLGTPVIATDNGMRPAGVRLIPIHDPSALETMVDRTLAETRGVQRRVADDGEENLAAVVRIYERLTGRSLLPVPTADR